MGSNLQVQLNALGDSDKLLSVRPRVEAGAPHWNARMHPYLNHEHARSDGTLSSIQGKPKAVAHSLLSVPVLES